MNPKPFPLRTLFSSSPPVYSLSIFISHFSTSQSQPFHSHSSSRHHEELSRQVKVSVWWDFENCSLPAGANVFKITHMITSAVRANGIKGPVHITAFGDVLQLSRTNQTALSATGVNLAHVPKGAKNSADRSLLVDLMYWISQNPPPAHLFLISGDSDFASVLHRLRMNNYNVLLASPDSAPRVLCSAASIMWNWDALLRGENLTGKHYNQPPDGPYSSWYGHYKVPLEDPFLVEKPASPRTEELSEGSSDSKPRPVPMAIKKHIQQILNSYPKGISITDLRSELNNSDVGLDKDLYGYKKFTQFLLSMPHILSLEHLRDGIYLVHGIAPKAGELSETIPSLSARPVFCRNGDELPVSSKSSGDGRTADGAVNGKSRLHHSPEVNSGGAARNVQQTPPENGDFFKVNAEIPPEEQCLPVGQKIAETSNDQVHETHQDPILEHHSASDLSFIRKVWQRWFGGSNDNSEGKSHVLPEKHGDSEHSSEKKCTGISSESEGMKEECEQKSCEVPYAASVGSSSNDSTVDTEATGEASEDNSGKRSALFNRIANWCKFWRSGQDSEASSDQSCEKLNQVNSNPARHEVFTRGSFWKDMEIFIDSPIGSLIVTKSRTRKEMAANLQKEGPLVLRSVNNSDLLQLVNLLISDKKWIEEYPSQTPPFRISRHIEKSPTLGHSHAANGLRSLFMHQSQANLQPNYEGDKKFQNIPHTGVSSTTFNKKSSDRSRSEILADCQKLVKDILKEHPEGYKMGNFWKLFFERYGYPLDIQRLGYKRLTFLLEKMPGVRIESNNIIPARMAPDNPGLETDVPNIRQNTSRALGSTACGLPDASTKGDEFDSAWDELGPIARRIDNRIITYPDYESSLSDDEISDLEGEISTSELPGRLQKPALDEVDSSLLQILDSWYSSKEGDDGKDNSEDYEVMIDCSEFNVKPSGAVEVDKKTEKYSEDNGKRPRVPKKNYSFVADPVGRDRDKLIHGILGTLKKSSESRMEA